VKLSTAIHVCIFYLKKKDFANLFLKMISLKVVHPLNSCQHTKLYCPTLTGARFASASEA
jgi:hypothetical protein